MPISNRSNVLGLLLATVLAPSLANADPATMPLLEGAGIHLYTQRAYEAFDPAVEAAVDERFDQLVAAGMDTGRHLFDWQDLEPSPGTYDTQLVIDAMDRLQAQGIAHQFPNLVVLDTAGPAVPPYVQALLDAGASWDDPRITAPFGDLLDVFVPLMLERGMFMLGLSNEPGGYYEDEPDRAVSFKGFVAAAVERAHRLEPDLATTVVFAGPRDPAIADLMPLGDVATFNYYFYRQEIDPSCELDGVALPLLRSDVAENVSAYLDELIAVADGRLVNIQEMGQASAGASLGPITSEANQAAVYAALIPALDARRAHIRTVCNWTLNDHRNAWETMAQGLIDEGLPACFADNFVDLFTETGVVRSDSTASPKPAFDIFREGIASLAGFVINEGIGGTWFNPGTPGQGFFVEIEPENRLIFVSWSTFRAAGDRGSGAPAQRWYTAAGPFEDRSATELEILQTTGGLLDDPQPVSTTAVGTLDIEFDDCDRGMVRYRFSVDGASGSIPIERPVPVAAALCETLAGMR